MKEKWCNWDDDNKEKINENLFEYYRELKQGSKHEKEKSKYITFEIELVSDKPGENEM